MTKKLTRAERYKRNYRLIKNAYQDATLSKHAQTWSDERIYKDLGVRVKNKKTPEIKSIDKTQKSYYTRKLNKYLYARSIGLEVKESKRLTRSKKAKIDSSFDYLDAASKKFNLKNKHRRMDLWSEWSSHPKGSDRGNFPPAIDHAARKLNKETKVAGKQLDEYAHYGYVVQFYMFVENKSFDEVRDLVRPDPNDAYRVRYLTTVRAI